MGGYSQKWTRTQREALNMGTKTRTFPISLKSTTTTAITEVFHLRNLVINPEDELAVFLEAIYCNGSLKSFNLFKFPEFDGDETEAEKLAKFTAAENASQKFGLRLLTRKTGETNWREKAEIIMVNRGRKDYFDLLNPYMSQQPLRLLEQNDEIAIQLVDYGYGLLKTDDFLELEFAIRIESEKKNEEIESLKQQVATLQLAIDGRLTNIAPNYFLGREVNSGVVQQIPFSRFATQSNIDQAITDLVGGSPGALDTLMELAVALNNDANFATTVANQLALKAPLTALANYYPKGGYSSNNPDTFTSGIEGADRNLGEGVSGWHFITNLRANNAYGFQLALSDTMEKIKYRIKTNNIWSLWQMLYVGDNPGFRSKIITGTTASAQGQFIQIAHGLTGSKIQNVEGIIRYSTTGTVPLNGTQTNYHSWISTDAIYLTITNVANDSAGILSLPFVATIWYLP